MALLETATKQVEACLEYRQPRLDQIKKYEDDYFHKVRPALKGRFNVPIPFLSGFTKTLMSKIDDTIKVKFNKGRESKLKSAKKVTSLWNKDSALDRGNYNGADMDAKKLAIFSGYTALKLVPSNKPYGQKLEVVDYMDLIFEPLGGANLDNHLYKGQLNIWKTAKDLKDGVKDGFYDKNKVNELLAISNDSKKTAQAERKNKLNRFSAMNLDPSQYGYTGSDVYTLTELITHYKGEDWYILFDMVNQIVIREELAKDVFPVDEANDNKAMCPWVAWHTERNPVNFMSQAPLDDIYPIAEAVRILLNQSFDNIQKRNWDQVFYDYKKILLSDLKYQPNGGIPVKLEKGESMANVVQQRQTPDTTGITINLATWLNSFIGEKTGVTPSAQGLGDEDKVGIFFGNLQQVADRFGLLNSFYKEAHIQIAKRYLANLRNGFFPTGDMIQYTGISGINEEELLKDDLEGLDIDIVSLNAEISMDRDKKQARSNSLVQIQKDESLRQFTSDEWLVSEILRNGQYEEDEIKTALDKEGSVNAELMSEGAEAIEMILEGETPKLNRGATPSFIRKIQFYAMDKSDDITDEEFAKLMKYAVDHIPIVKKNLQIISDTTQAIRPTPEAPVSPETNELPEKEPVVANASNLPV